MRIKDWMSTQVITISPDTSMIKASKLMKENKIRRLPVVDTKNTVVGIVSDRDVKQASPSKATSLDIHEVNYLLSEMKVKDLMTRNPICVRPTDTVEAVARIMAEKRFGGIPVVEETGELVGIITESDLFAVLVAITGVNLGSVQFAFTLSNEPGQMRPLLDCIREGNGQIVSILTAQETEDASQRKVYIRIKNMPLTEEQAIIATIEKNFANQLRYWTKDKNISE